MNPRAFHERRQLPARLVSFVPLALLLGASCPVATRGDPLLGSPVSFATGFFPYSVAIGDLNDDGKPDLAIASYDANTVTVLLGDGTGSFGSRVDHATGTGPSSVAIGDVNGDSKPDLLVANFGACCEFAGSVSVLLGTGGGGFGAKTDFGTASGPWSVAVGDANDDGKLDVVTANNGSSLTNSVSVLLGNGDGSFAAKTDYDVGSQPRSVAIADLSGDGKPDLAVANAGPIPSLAGTVSVLLGAGDGSFDTSTDYATGFHSTSVAIADVNGNGKPDLVVANAGLDPDYLGTVSVLLGAGDGSFGGKTDFGTGNAPYSVAIGDLDGDGEADVVTANQYGSFPVLLASVSVLRGHGDGTFGLKDDYVTGDDPVSVAIGDVDGDSKLDIATANSTAHTVSVLLNVGTVPTATLLALFEATWISAGIELKWRFGLAGSVEVAAIERGESADGPWKAVGSERRDDGDTVVLLDSGVEPGRTYYYRLVATPRAGRIQTFGPLAVTAAPLEGIELSVAPSPSRGAVRVDFALAHPSDVRLGVLDAQGRLVARLADGVYSAGRHQATWDATGAAESLPAGIYFLRLEAAGTTAMRRLILVR